MSRLQTVQTTIQNLPDVSFEDYYQQYVQDSQDMIVSKEASLLRASLTSLKDVTKADKEISDMIKEFLK